MTLTIPFVNPRWRGAPTQRDNSSGAALKRGLAGVEKGTAIGCSRPGIAGMGPVHACHGGRADLDTYANAWLESEGKRMDDSMGKREPGQRWSPCGLRLVPAWMFAVVALSVRVNWRRTYPLLGPRGSGFRTWSWLEAWVCAF